MATSIAGAKADLFALFSFGGAPTVAGIKAVYPFEPAAGKLAKPTSMTVATAGMSAEFYRLTLRIYYYLDANVQTAQDNLDGLIMAAEALLTSTYARTDWSVQYVEDIDAIVAACDIEAPREDYL